MTNDMIRQIALANGFKLKVQDDGTTDLNPYVYDFAHALLAPVVAQRDQAYVLMEKHEDEAREMPGFWGGFAADMMHNAKKAEAERDALWETLIKIADALDIDYHEARKADGKPSDVFIAHIKSMETTINRLEAQVEHLGEISGND